MFACKHPLSQLGALPQDVFDEVIGAYLDDQSIEPIFRFYEKAHGDPSNNNNDNNVSNDAIPEDATTDSKENENNNGTDHEDKQETISKEFNADKDILVNVLDFVTGGRGVVNILTDSELNKTDMTKHQCEDHDHVERPGRIAVHYYESKIRFIKKMQKISM